MRCADIDWLEAADNYVTVHAGGRALLMRRTLAGLLDDLGTAFVRCHRSAAVALAQVAAVRPRDKGDATLVLRQRRRGAVQPAVPRRRGAPRCSAERRRQPGARSASGSPRRGAPSAPQCALASRARAVA